MEYPQEVLEKKFQSLPKDIQTAISSVEIAKELDRISLDHNLMLDQTDTLANETTYLMLGLTHPDRFIIRLKDALKLDTEGANELAKDVNERILLNIRESIKNIHLEQKKETEQKIIEKPSGSAIDYIFKRRSLPPAPSELQHKQTTPNPVPVAEIKPTVAAAEKKIEVNIPEPIKPALAPTPEPAPVKPAPIPVPEPKKPKPKQEIVYNPPREETAPKIDTKVQQPVKKREYTNPYLIDRERLLYDIENPKATKHSPYPFESGLSHSNQKPTVPTPPQAKINADLQSNSSKPANQVSKQPEETKIPINKPRVAPTITPSPSPIYKPATEAMKVETANVPIAEKPKEEVQKTVQHSSLVPEVAPESHLTIKEGETAHNVPIPPQNMVKTPPPQQQIEVMQPTPTVIPKEAPNRPTVEPKKPLNILDQKLSSVMAPKTDKKYIDPYREPID